MGADENGRMLLNGVPTNIHSGQRDNTPRETEVFQTPPQTPRQQSVLDVDDEGVIYLNRILSLDPTCEDLMDLLPCGKPRPPHDFDQNVLTEESPLNQWPLDGSSRRSHQHWRQIYQYHRRHTTGAGKSKGKAPALPKGTKGKGKGKKVIDHKLHHLHPQVRVEKVRKEMVNRKMKPALTQGKTNETPGKASSSTGASAVTTTAPSTTPQPKPMLSKPGKVPKQCAYFTPPGGCQKGEKCMCLRNGGRQT